MIKYALNLEEFSTEMLSEILKWRAGEKTLAPRISGLKLTINTGVSLYDISSYMDNCFAIAFFLDDIRNYGLVDYIKLDNTQFNINDTNGNVWYDDHELKFSTFEISTSQPTTIYLYFYCVEEVITQNLFPVLITYVNEGGGLLAQRHLFYPKGQFTIFPIKLDSYIPLDSSKILTVDENLFMSFTYRPKKPGVIVKNLWVNNYIFKQEILDDLDYGEYIVQVENTEKPNYFLFSENNIPITLTTEIQKVTLDFYYQEVN